MSNIPMAANKDPVDKEADAVPFEGTDRIECTKTQTLLSSVPLLQEKQFVQLHFKYLPPELKVDYYDVLLFYDENDYEKVEAFRKTISDISLKNGKKLTAFLYNGPEFASLVGGKNENLEVAFERCTFVFVFLSEFFMKNDWCKFMTHLFLQKMTSDSEKRWCVVPVFPAPRKKIKFDIPMVFITIRGVEFHPEGKPFIDDVKSMVSRKCKARVEKENALTKQRYLFLKQNEDCLERVFTEEVTTDQNETSCGSADIIYERCNESLAKSFENLSCAMKTKSHTKDSYESNQNEKNSYRTDLIVSKDDLEKDRLSDNDSEESHSQDLQKPDTTGDACTRM